MRIRTDILAGMCNWNLMKNTDFHQGYQISMNTVEQRFFYRHQDWFFLLCFWLNGFGMPWNSHICINVNIKIKRVYNITKDVLFKAPFRYLDTRLTSNTDTYAHLSLCYNMSYFGNELKIMQQTTSRDENKILIICLYLSNYTKRLLQFLIVTLDLIA